MNAKKPDKLFLFFLSLLFCACSDDAVSLLRVSHSLILDYEDADSLPKARLSVWAELSSDARRVESILVQNGDYSWTVDSPVLISEGKKQWAGYMRLEPPPQADSFQPGLYFVRVTDAAGNTGEGSFNLVFEPELLKNSSDYAKNKFPAAQEKVAVYSKSGELLYFDRGEVSWRNDSDIFKAFKSSDFLRKSLASGGLVCLFPKIFKDGEKTDDGQ